MVGTAYQSTEAVYPQAAVSFAYLDEDNEADQEDTIKAEQFMDAHGLLLELQDERKKLSDPAKTHLGVGFAYNRTKVKVVELLS